MNIKRLHATSVAIEDYGVAISGDSCTGKSDLSLRLIDSGATLISDDITVFSKSENYIHLFGVENTKGLLEVREIGIITVPYIEGIKLKLVIKLTDKEIERIPKKNQINLLGLRFPKLEINGKNSSSVAKVKVKLNEINE